MQVLGSLIASSHRVANVYAVLKTLVEQHICRHVPLGVHHFGIRLRGVCSSLIKVGIHIRFVVSDATRDARRQSIMMHTSGNWH